jgi:hypothetical protein
MTAPRPVAAWTRMAVVQGLQVPAVALGLVAGGAAWWPAGLWGSVVCCAGTDSGWRWRNRLLLFQAVVWLVLAASLGSGS